jgi:hypothetical protein
MVGVDRLHLNEFASNQRTASIGVPENPAILKDALGPKAFPLS